MLIVVVVGDGDCDGAGLSGTLHGAERNAAAHRGQQHHVAACAGYRLNYLLGNREIHGSADRVVTCRVTNDLCHTRMRGQLLPGWVVINDEITAGVQILDNAPLWSFPGVT